MLRSLQGNPKQSLKLSSRLFSVSSLTHQEKKEIDTQGIDEAVKNIITSINGKKRKEVLAELRGTVDVKPLGQIQRESADRFYDRYIRPSVRWQSKVKNTIKLSNKTMKIDENIRVLDLIKENLHPPKESLSVSDFFLPLDLGDVVELSTNLDESGLAVIVELPSKSDDPRYTVMNRLGQLSFLEKSSFKFRIPRLIPKDRLTGMVYEVKDQDVEDYGSIKMEHDGFSKYAVNPIARTLVVKPILDLTINSWNSLQEISRKLEIIHRLIQQDLGPKEVSIFSITKAIKHLNLVRFKKDVQDLSIDQAYSNMRTRLIQTVGADFSVEHQLGRDVSRISADDTFDIVSFYAVILGLRKQSRIWNASYNSKATLFPLSVTALPLQYTHRLDRIADTIANDRQLTSSFHNFVSDSLANEEQLKSTEIPYELTDIFFLLKEYAVGNVKDSKLETIVALLMKVHHPTQDITRSLVYDFLIKFQLIDQIFANPTHFSTHLALPNKGVSQKSDMEQILYSAIDTLAEPFEHDLAESRTDLTNLKVFCIDSEKAHEIDDGISLEKLNDSGDFKIYVHIADPTSFIKKDSSLFRIAYDRAFTVYQPEMVSTMLPDRISQVAGLGIDGQKTRAITFSIPFNINDKIIEFNKCNVEASYISQFPKGFYYSKVAKLLNGESEGTESVHVENLNHMYSIAQILRDKRIESGGVIFGESIGVQIRVDETTGKLDDFHLNQESTDKATTLVSEFMILANRIAGEFLTRNGIPGVYKTMAKLPLAISNGSVLKKLNELSKNPDSHPTLSDIVKLFKFISASSYSSTGSEHSMLGCHNYAPSTSPLRRFGDMINHYQYHTYFNNKRANAMFDEDEVLAMSLHIESKNDIIKRNSNIASSFYVISHFKSLIESKSLDSFDIIINSKVVDGGSVFGILRKFGIFVNLKYHLGKNPPNIGDVITVKLRENGEYNMEFIEFDAVGNSVVMKQLL
ncbi:hypothetical protein WICPIJ_002841 [Wickerhamomyces pijperi]|uniref:RNB domain-containing protein n=1 Tax=Wickerhamomyces pijperi TaxID=599730 RepID=A0A9P8Q912_WICPI|nr:hypothetical protein WICPIJ_002841 [Wickerhamomyces pijperi]